MLLSGNRFLQNIIFVYEKNQEEGNSNNETVDTSSKGITKHCAYPIDIENRYHYPACSKLWDLFDPKRLLVAQRSSRWRGRKSNGLLQCARCGLRKLLHTSARYIENCEIQRGIGTIRIGK